MAKIGVSTRKFWPKIRDIIEVIGFVDGLCKVVEIWVEPPFFPEWRTDREKGVIDRLLDADVAYDIDYTLHAPIKDLNLASWNPLVASNSIKEVEKTLEMAAIIDADVVVFHPGSIIVDRQSSLMNLNESLLKIDDIAGDYNVVACLENMGRERYLCTDPDETRQMLDEFEHIQLAFDLAHVWRLPDKPFDGFVKTLPDKIKHIHVSDIIEGDDRHLPVGGGEADYNNWLKQIKDSGYDKSFILEGDLKNDDIESFKDEVTLLKDMLSRAGFNTSF